MAPEWRGSQYRPAVHFFCGGAAGIFASVVSFPFDTVRTRLVAQGENKVCPLFPPTLGVSSYFTNI